MHRIKWVWENLDGHRWQMMICYILAMIGPVMVLINPQIASTLIDRGITGGETEIILPLALAMCGVTLARASLDYTVAIFGDLSSQGLVLNLRKRLFQSMQEKDMAFYDTHRTGDLMTTMTSDLDIVRHNVSYNWRQLVAGPFLMVVTLIYFATINWVYMLAILVLSPIIALILNAYRKRVRPIYIDLRERLSHLSTNAQENIDGNRVVKAFANEEFEIQKFEKKNVAFVDQNLTAVRAWLKVFPFVETMSQSLGVISLLVGGLLIINGQMTYGQYWACNSLIWAVSNPLKQLGTLLNDLQRFVASVDRLIEVQMYRPRITNPEIPETTDQRMNGEVEFKDVTFRFGDSEIFSGINFHAKPGETVAIMGETGSGKTTITNLISRFYDVKKGSVLVDGIDVRQWDLHTLRSNIGMATQDVFLFSDSVDGNIAYGRPDLSEEEVHHFAKVADADFIEKMSDGFDTIIGERGVGLSGGQKQRIALARALALRPSILILDDTTSAVDMETEKYIQEQLANLDFACTKFIIAQRISSVRHADQILILRGGKIAEYGTHKELLAKRGYYYDIYRIQQGMAEGVEL